MPEAAPVTSAQLVVASFCSSARLIGDSTDCVNITLEDIGPRRGRERTLSRKI
jgi:hypothetical protein